MAYTKQQMVAQLARANRDIDPSILAAFRLTLPRGEKSIGLLFVTKDTVGVGIQPLHFYPTNKCKWPYIIVDITPAEYQRLLKGKLKLPDGWGLGKEL